MTSARLETVTAIEVPSGASQVFERRSPITTPGHQRRPPR